MMRRGTASVSRGMMVRWKSPSFYKRRRFGSWVELTKMALSRSWIHWIGIVTGFARSRAEHTKAAVSDPIH